MKGSESYTKVTPLGLLIAFGIIYGDIGTSPLYTMKFIVGGHPITETLVLGGVSCIFWTITLQTTLKYVWITLSADNHGEGGIFSLFAIIKNNYKWLTPFAILGGSALLADSVITPPISISSAIEGLKILYPGLNTVPFVLAILCILFAIQILGTEKVGKSFGPIMIVWFLMIGLLGIRAILSDPTVLKAVNPLYAYKLLATFPHGFWLLGSVFLCTTGAEALYSDMGHCGKNNVRVSWGLVKLCLLLNYFGQAAWLLHQGEMQGHANPFYGLMPSWFMLPGIGISTVATIIASQALISGAYTLINEAVRLGFWPKVRILYPSDAKGQLYVPSVNLLLWVGCVAIVLYFKESSNMEAAYGLAITVTMLITTFLLAFYLHLRGVPKLLIALFLLVYGSIEVSFFAANVVKFMHGGYVSVVITAVLVGIMLVWHEASNVKMRLTEYEDLEPYIPRLVQLSKDENVPKYGTHLVYMTSAMSTRKIESKILFSILEQKPKRADIYWFVHVEVTSEPHTMQYKVDVLVPEDIIKVTFKLGFRVEQRLSSFIKYVMKELSDKKEINIEANYQTSGADVNPGDITFIVLKKFLSYENDLPFLDKLVLRTHFILKDFTQKESEWFGIDEHNVEIEMLPLVISPGRPIYLERI